MERWYRCLHPIHGSWSFYRRKGDRWQVLHTHPSARKEWLSSMFDVPAEERLQPFWLQHGDTLCLDGRICIVHELIWSPAMCGLTVVLMNGGARGLRVGEPHLRQYAVLIN